MPQVILDMTKLMEIKANVGRNLDEVLGDFAFDCQGEIVDHFSRTAPDPSRPGEPPAVQTGYLKGSIVAKPDGHLRWVVHIGADYGPHLEYGTVKMAARPFVLPAFRRTVANIPPGIIQEIIE